MEHKCFSVIYNTSLFIYQLQYCRQAGWSASLDIEGETPCSCVWVCVRCCEQLFAAVCSCEGWVTHCCLVWISLSVTLSLLKEPCWRNVTVDFFLMYCNLTVSFPVTVCPFSSKDICFTSPLHFLYLSLPHTLSDVFFWCGWIIVLFLQRCEICAIGSENEIRSGLAFSSWRMHG